MIKKIIFGITILLNIILSVVLVFTIIRSENEITSNYDEDALTEVADSSVKTELERENFGYVGARTRPWRYGAQGQEGSEDYYKLGEYPHSYGRQHRRTGCSSGNSTKLQVTGIP